MIDYLYYRIKSWLCTWSVFTSSVCSVCWRQKKQSSCFCLQIKKATLSAAASPHDKNSAWTTASCVLRLLNLLQLSPLSDNRSRAAIWSSYCDISHFLFFLRFFYPPPSCALFFTACKMSLLILKGFLCVIYDSAVPAFCWSLYCCLNDNNRSYFAVSLLRPWSKCWQNIKTYDAWISFWSCAVFQCNHLTGPSRWHCFLTCGLMDISINILCVTKPVSSQRHFCIWEDLISNDKSIHIFKRTWKSALFKGH